MGDQNEHCRKLRSSMESILERYDRYTYAEKRVTAKDSDQQDNWSLECPKLMSRIELLQRNIRRYAGEDLDLLSLRELQSLEQQLDTALKRIRTRKNQVMNESISELHKQEKALQEQNNTLAKKLKEKEKIVTERSQLEQQHLVQNSSALVLPECLPLPSLRIGVPFQANGALGCDEDDGRGGGRSTPGSTNSNSNSNPLMPPWLVRHINK